MKRYKLKPAIQSAAAAIAGEPGIDDGVTELVGEGVGQQAGLFLAVGLFFALTLEARVRRWAPSLWDNHKAAGHSR